MNEVLRRLLSVIFAKGNGMSKKGGGGWLFFVLLTPNNYGNEVVSLPLNSRLCVGVVAVPLPN